jgi:hypothetical protein
MHLAEIEQMLLTSGLPRQLRKTCHSKKWRLKKSISTYDNEEAILRKSLTECEVKFCQFYLGYTTSPSRHDLAFSANVQCLGGPSCNGPQWLDIAPRDHDAAADTPGAIPPATSQFISRMPSLGSFPPTGREIQTHNLPRLEGGGVGQLEWTWSPVNPASFMGSQWSTQSLASCPGSAHPGHEHNQTTSTANLRPGAADFIPGTDTAVPDGPLRSEEQRRRYSEAAVDVRIRPPDGLASRTPHRWSDSFERQSGKSLG